MYTHLLPNLVPNVACWFPSSCSFVWWTHTDVQKLLNGFKKKVAVTVFQFVQHGVEYVR